MSWSALVGAFIGAGIPTILGYIKALNARRMADAEAFGPALLLLDRMDPIRVTMNVGSREVERARWEELSKRVDAACERLLVISAGHPRRVVRELARQAQRKLSNVRQASSWAVSDLLQNRDNPTAPASLGYVRFLLSTVHIDRVLGCSCGCGGDGRGRC